MFEKQNLKILCNKILSFYSFFFPLGKHCVECETLCPLVLHNLSKVAFCMHISWSFFVGRNYKIRRSQWPRGLRRRSTAVRLLRSWVRIPPRAWMFVLDCCVLSGRGLCDGPIIRSEESYRLWRVVICNQETS